MKAKHLVANEVPKIHKLLIINNLHIYKNIIVNLIDTMII